MNTPFKSNPAVTTPEVTVSMPAYNAGRFIRQAIDSVLQQEGIDLELIVVDDRSRDDTATLVGSVRDPRVVLIRNQRHRGIGACHNIVLRHSRAPYIAHVDADDFLLPGALRELVDAVADDPNVGQTHCYFFEVDARGRTTRDAFARSWHARRRECPPGVNHREALRLTSMANHLRTFRRAVLQELGGFDELLPYGVDYDMALRIAERYEIRVVREFLYARRLHDRNTTVGRRFRILRRWANNYRIRRRLIDSGRVSFLRDPMLDFAGLLREYHEDVFSPVFNRAHRCARRVAAIVLWRVWAPWLATLHEGFQFRFRE